MQKKINHTLIFCSLFFCINVKAQQKFQKTYGSLFADFGSSVQKTDAGGFIICGTLSKDTVQMDTDIFLLRTDSAGDTLWTKSYGGSGSDLGECVQQTADGGFIVTGISNSYGAGSDDVLLMKIKANGDTAWLKTFGGPQGELGHYVQQTFDGGYVVAGHTDSYGVRGECYVIRTDSMGDTLWTKTYGGANHDHAFCIEQTSDSGLIIVGHTLSFGDTSGGFYAVKTNAAGDLQWSKAYGGSRNSYAYSVQQTFDAGFIIAGVTESFGAGGNDFYVVKTDSSGDTLWTRTYGGAGEDIARCIKRTLDSCFVIAGTSNSFGNGDDNVCLLKIKPDGDTIWSKQFGGNKTEEGFGLIQNSNGGFVVCGDSKSFASANFDLYLVSTDSVGNSDCHQANAPLIITRPASFAVNALTDVLVTGTEITHPAMNANPGTMVYDACAFSATIQETVNVIESGYIIVYPNPTNGSFYFSLSPEIKEIKEIKVTDQLGHIIYDSGSEEHTQLKSKEIHLQGVSPGIYFVRFVVSERTFTSKILVD